MAQYDSTVIREFADRLYQQARTLVVIFSVVLSLAGGVLGQVFGAAVSRDAAPAMAVLGGVVGAVLGYAIGRELGFGLRLRAQTALCQVQIEENTRRAALAGEVLAAPAVAQVRVARPV